MWWKLYLADMTAQSVAVASIFWGKVLKSFKEGMFFLVPSFGFLTLMLVGLTRKNLTKKLKHGII